MKFVRWFTFFSLLIFCGALHAYEDKFILIGQNGNDTAFALECVGNVLGEHLQINDNGEVYIKVDKIIAVPKQRFSKLCVIKSLLDQYKEQEDLRQNSCSNDQNAYTLMENLTQCGSRVSQPTKWQCPYCHRWYELGEKCDNEDCPTNRW